MQGLEQRLVALLEQRRLLAVLVRHQVPQRRRRRGDDALRAARLGDGRRSDEADEARHGTVVDDTRAQLVGGDAVLEQKAEGLPY